MPHLERKVGELHSTTHNEVLMDVWRPLSRRLWRIRNKLHNFGLMFYTTSDIAQRIVNINIVMLLFLTFFIFSDPLIG